MEVEQIKSELNGERSRRHTKWLR